MAVIPVQTGIQVRQLLPGWIPAYAGKIQSGERVGHAHLVLPSLKQASWQEIKLALSLEAS
ncbi:MAG: hypothetical protein ACKO24_00255 [Leptolyngbyaceae cyanobacterium]